MESTDRSEGLVEHRHRARLRAALLSLVAGLFIFGLKFWAYAWTGSAAILSDALESIVNIVAAALAAYSVWLSSQPADENHPYGHGKVEDFSAGVEGTLIVVAAGAILFTSIPRFFDPRPLSDFGRGSVILMVATAMNCGLGWYLLRVGRRERSRALEADGKHILTDVISSGAAFVALLLVHLTSWSWVDPLIACGIAVHILGSGFQLIRESVRRLMDEADLEMLDGLSEALHETRKPTWVDLHELRAWWAGNLLQVDCHLMLPRFWTIDEAHETGDELETTIRQAVGGQATVVVHVDPCRDEFCHQCPYIECELRAAAYQQQPAWDRERLSRIVKI